MSSFHTPSAGCCPLQLLKMDDRYSTDSSHGIYTIFDHSYGCIRPGADQTETEIELSLVCAERLTKHDIVTSNALNGYEPFSIDGWNVVFNCTRIAIVKCQYDGAI